MKIYLVLEYDSKDRCRVHQVFSKKEYALAQIEKLNFKEELKFKPKERLSYHLLTKSVKGLSKRKR